MTYIFVVLKEHFQGHFCLLFPKYPILVYNLKYIYTMTFEFVD